MCKKLPSKLLLWTSPGIINRSQSNCISIELNRTFYFWTLVIHVLELKNNKFFQGDGLLVFRGSSYFSITRGLDLRFSPFFVRGFISVRVRYFYFFTVFLVPFRSNRILDYFQHTVSFSHAPWQLYYYIITLHKVSESSQHVRYLFEAWTVNKRT